MPAGDTERPRGVSVVIPTFNSAPWLPATLRALDAAVAAAGASQIEVVVVDDGSTDDTGDILEVLAPKLDVPLTVIRTVNQGRFLARWTGVSAARYSEIMLVDSRVLVDRQALRYVADVRAHGDGDGPWNAHVDTSADTSLVGLFWEVPTYVFWGAYRAQPRPMLITPENFDRLPKGTTCFLVPHALYEEACLANWPTENAHLISDDTKILRHIAKRQAIRIDPGFRVEYRPRQSVRHFLEHSFVRGTLFVSSYAGTTRLRDAVLILLGLSVPVALAALVAAVVAGALVLWLVALLSALVVATAVPTVIALTRRCPGRAALSFVAYLVPFGAVFWAGLCRGLIVHRASWWRVGRRNGRSPAPPEANGRSAA